MTKRKYQKISRERNNFTGSSEGFNTTNYWYYVQVFKKNRHGGGSDVFYRGRVTAPNKAHAREQVRVKFMGRKNETLEKIDILTKKTW